MVYSICLTKPFVAVEQESQNGMVSVKVAELQLAIHQGDKEHAINVFKGQCVGTRGRQYIFIQQYCHYYLPKGQIHDLKDLLLTIL